MCPPVLKKVADHRLAARAEGAHKDKAAKLLHEHKIRDRQHSAPLTPGPGRPRQPRAQRMRPSKGKRRDRRHCETKEHRLGMVSARMRHVTTLSVMQAARNCEYRRCPRRRNEPSTEPNPERRAEPCTEPRTGPGRKNGARGRACTRKPRKEPRTETSEEPRNIQCTARRRDACFPHK